MIALARREGNAAKLSKKIRADPKLELNHIFWGFSIILSREEVSNAGTA